MRLPFRTRLLLGFGPLVVIMGTVSTLAGLSFITDTVMKEAMLKVKMDLNGAWSAYEDEKARLQVVIGISSQRESWREAVRAHRGTDEMAGELETVRRKYQLDYLSIADAEGVVLLRSRFPYATGDTVAADPVVQTALRGEVASGTILLPAEVLRKEGEELAERAFIPLVFTERAVPTNRTVESRGMALEAAVPIVDASGDVRGVVYGGILLNRKFDLVDRIRNTVFGDRTFDGRPVGTVTLFLGDVRIATNVTLDTGARALGTRVSQAVYERVIERGEGFADRAFVVNDWYLSAYDPIRDPTGRVIGIVYVGLLERIYSGYRLTLAKQYVGISSLALIVCVFISLAISSEFRRPLLKLVQANRELSAGKLNARVHFGRGSREMHELAAAFNSMAEQLERDRSEIEASARAAQRAYAEAAERNRAYLEMLGFVTHELKSPLASIVFGVSALRDLVLGPLTPDQAAVLKAVATSAQYLQDTIANYLNLSRIEEGELRLRPVPVFYRKDVILPAIEGLSELASDRGMTVTCQVPEDRNGTGDRDLLLSVFQNLLSNAIKYGHEGGRVAVWEEGSGRAGTVCFHVWNEGRGFDRAAAEKLFLKFSRLPTSGEDTRSGTGLGLFVSARIIEKHGGTIRAESEPGQWADFVITLPTSMAESVDEGKVATETGGS